MARRSNWSYRDYFGYYTPSRPLEAKGGIKAQTKRGAFGKSWWAKRWIGVLESFSIGARLQRGRSYARRGQVTAIEIDEGMVIASVQGSRARPYKVVIGVKTLSGDDWTRVAKAVGQEALIAAKLLAGEMPENIEEVFKGVKLSLFPAKRQDLTTQCSCPDWSNPCKHIAAVYYLLGEEFDRDPFLIFKLRGMNREALVDAIGNAGGFASGGAGEKAPPEPEPLPVDPDVFWGLEEHQITWGEVRSPKVTAPLVRRLGGFPFWRGKERFLDAMENMYEIATHRGLAVFLGDPG